MSQIRIAVSPEGAVTAVVVGDDVRRFSEMSEADWEALIQLARDGGLTVVVSADYSSFERA